MFVHSLNLGAKKSFEWYMLGILRDTTYRLAGCNGSSWDIFFKLESAVYLINFGVMKRDMSAAGSVIRAVLKLFAFSVYFSLI